MLPIRFFIILQIRNEFLALLLGQMGPRERGERGEQVKLNEIPGRKKLEGLENRAFETTE
jgi:hypothetical protein